jgi:peptidoglycan-associated lipoprotein
MTNAKTALLLTTLTALLGACSSTPIATPPPAQTVSAAPRPLPEPVQPAAPAPTPQPVPTSAIATVTLPAYLDPKSEIYAGRSVYFDFDAAALKPSSNTLVELQGQYLAAHPKLAVRVEGNTDDRGSAEYNLALGQKRAEALRQALKVFGVNDSQLDVVSWGKEKPRALGDDESAWVQNRRADLVYPAK